MRIAAAALAPGIGASSAMQTNVLPTSMHGLDGPRSRGEFPSEMERTVTRTPGMPARLGVAIRGTCEAFSALPENDAQSRRTDAENASSKPTAGISALITYST